MQTIELREMDTVVTPGIGPRHSETAASSPAVMAAIRTLIEEEASLLDNGDFSAWCDLYAEDAIYWVPAQHGQQSWTSHVSLFYDDKHTMRTRVQRLNHAQLHCQEPRSHCVRLLSNIRLGETSADGIRHTVHTKFMMFEDRPAKPQRIFGGSYEHQLVWHGEHLKIARKRVNLTNCDQSFPSLSQPF